MKLLSTVLFILLPSLSFAANCTMKVELSNSGCTFGNDLFSPVMKRKLVKIMEAKGYTVSEDDSAEYHLSYLGSNGSCIEFEGRTPFLYPDTIFSSLYLTKGNMQLDIGADQMKEVFTMWPNSSRPYRRLFKKSVSSIRELVPDCH